jgi:hypothetical protein
MPRQFLAGFVRRIVLYDTEGIIELVEQPSLAALHAVGPSDNWGEENTKGVPPRHPRRYAPRLIHGKSSHIPMDGTPSGIRTRGLHLERVMS